ncbi:hypothetical protein Cni_G23699 [Canna indica]|uniref:Methyltransferase n=1 Tax=Canna indica TaxID=4628 RepID=A0AAQ3KXN8_9LILI|nr:hypothetical protein Cni_G23699 [Canna indica]
MKLANIEIRYVNLKACITCLPENGYEFSISSWLSRLHEPPKRLQEYEMDVFVAKKDLFRTESGYRDEIVKCLILDFPLEKMKLQNMMCTLELDLRGEFAATLINQQIDCWVMNVVPVSGPNTLPVIYDGGLTGVSYDQLNILGILVEMERIVRPGGHIFIRDSRYIMEEIFDFTSTTQICVILKKAIMQTGSYCLIVENVY